MNLGLDLKIALDAPRRAAGGDTAAQDPAGDQAAAAALGAAVEDVRLALAVSKGHRKGWQGRTCGVVEFLRNVEGQRVYS